MSAEEACYFVYVTTPDQAVAQELARRVVEESMAACANILPAMTSIYRWQGKLEEAQEAVLVLKTRAETWPALRDRLVALHPYECPCVVALPIAAGQADFMAWIRAMSTDPTTDKKSP